MKLSSLTVAAALLATPLASPLSAQRHVSIPIAGSTSGKPTQIQADLYGHGQRALLLLHGGRFNKESWRDQAPVFARAGFLVLAINFRGDRPNPDGTPGSYGTDEDNAADVLAAVNYLHQHAAKSISAIGGSLGGDALGNAEAQSPAALFDKMVFLGSEGGDHPEKLRGRKLYIVARDDSNGSGPRLPSITSHFKQAGEPKQLIVLDGSAHAQFIFPTPQGTHLMRLLLDFLAPQSAKLATNH